MRMFHLALTGIAAIMLAGCAGATANDLLSAQARGASAPIKQSVASKTIAEIVISRVKGKKPSPLEF